MPTFEAKPTGWFRPDPAQPRKQFDEADLRRLGESLQMRQNDPLQALPDGTIIDGERRWRAAVLVALETLDAIITDQALTPAQVATIRLTTFFHRVDLSHHEKWQAVVDCLEQNPDWDYKRAAAEFKVDNSTITRLVSPSNCIPEVVEALRERKIGISDCYAISKHTPSDQPGLLAHRLSPGSTRDTLERQGRKKRSSNGTSVRVPSIKIALAGDISVVVKGEAIDLDQGIEALKDAIKAMTKARDTGLDAKTAQAVWKDIAKAG